MAQSSDRKSRRRQPPGRERLGAELPNALELAKTANLVGDLANPRHHGRAQNRALARSIEACGFNAPILVDRDQRIVAGHGRHEAAKLLGLEQVPIIRLEHLSEAQARAYMLADNKLGDRSSWDDTRLALQLKELSALAVDFEIEATGFELPEIDFHIQSLDAPETADRNDEFEFAAGPAVTQPGDLWRLGEHAVYCGSALDPKAYEVLLEGQQAAGAFTDPPYNVKIGGHVTGKGATRHREFAMASGEMTPSEFTEFLRRSLELLTGNSAEGAVLYACMDWRHMAEILAAGQAANCDLLNVAVWVKSNGGMGALYRSRHELVFIFRNGSCPHVNNVQLGRYGRNRSNVWHHAGQNSFRRKGQENGLDYHPTVKPIGMVSDAILDTTNRGDLVLDPFLGSGTTLLATQRTGRRCRGIELDPLYVDTVIDRWERMTGGKARDAQGLTYAERKQAAGGTS